MLHQAGIGPFQDLKGDFPLREIPFPERSEVDVDIVEEEARERRELTELDDLLLHERRRGANARLVPVVALLAQIPHEHVRVLVRWQGA